MENNLKGDQSWWGGRRVPSRATGFSEPNRNHQYRMREEVVKRQVLLRSEGDYFK